MHAAIPLPNIAPAAEAYLKTITVSFRCFTTDNYMFSSCFLKVRVKVLFLLLSCIQLKNYLILNTSRVSATSLACCYTLTNNKPLALSKDLNFWKFLSYCTSFGG